MKRLGTELLFSSVTTVVGTLVVLIIQRSQHVGASVILALLLVTAIVLTVNYQHELILFIRDKGNWRVPSRLNTTWSFQIREGRVTVQDSLALRVIGSYISGDGVSVSVTGDTDLLGFHYKLRGEIKAEGLIEGQWWTDAEGRNFCGTFQMQLSRGSEDAGQKLIARGKWTGVSRRDGVRAGDWDWYVTAY